MSKKLWTLVSLLLLASLVLVACQPAATETPTEEPQAPPAAQPTEEMPDELTGTITLWHSLKEGGELEAMTAAISAFQDANPGVQFDVLYTPFEDLRSKYETAAATGGGPTVLVGAADWGPALYDAELVADVGGLASLAFLQGINQAALGSVRYREALVGMPLGLKGVVMYRNTSIIPEAPATYDDLVAAAEAATQGDIVGADLERGQFFAFGHLYGLGGQLMTEAGDPAFNNEQGVAWLNLTNSFSEAGPTEFNTDNDVNLFKTGTAGIIIDGTWNLAPLAEAIGEQNLAVDPWPSPLSGFVQTDNIYLSANAEGDDRAASWGFMEYILSQDGQGILARENSGFIPATLGVEVPDRLRQEAVAAFEGGVAFPVIPEMGAYWGPMETAQRSVYDEGADPEFALGQAFNSINAAVAEIRGETPPEPEVLGTVTLWHSLKEGGELEAMTAAISAFQEANPGVQFDVLYTPFEDLRSKYETAVATGGGPTMLVGAADWGPAFYDAELVADVSPFASTAFLSSINQAALGAVQYEGALVGLPLGLKGVVMYRNTSIIPEAPATFEDLVAAAEAATQGDIVGADLERGQFFAFGHLYGLGGQLMTEAGDPAFNNEQGVAWLTLTDSFTDAGPAEFNTDNDVNLFKTGTAGIIIDGTWNLAPLAEAIGEENLAVDPWPSPLSGFVQTDNIYLSANAEGDDQSATWAFMKYLLSPDGQAILARENSGYIPAAVGVEVPDRLRQEAVAAFEGGVAFPVIPEMGAYWGPMETAQRSVYDEGADPAAALATAEESITAAIVEIRGQ